MSNDGIKPVRETRILQPDEIMRVHGPATLTFEELAPEPPPEPVRATLPHGPGYWGQPETEKAMESARQHFDWFRPITPYWRGEDREIPFIVPLFVATANERGSGVSTLTNLEAAGDRLRSPWCIGVHLDDEAVPSDARDKLRAEIRREFSDAKVFEGPMPFAICSQDMFAGADYIVSYQNCTRDARHPLDVAEALARAAWYGKPLVFSINPFDNAGNKTGVADPADFKTALEAAQYASGYCQWGIPRLLQLAELRGCAYVRPDDVRNAYEICTNILPAFRWQDPASRPVLRARPGPLREDVKVNRAVCRIVWRAGKRVEFVPDALPIHDFWATVTDGPLYGTVEGEKWDYLKILWLFAQPDHSTPEIRVGLDECEARMAERLGT